jgi:succinate dehydrogenase / fumarate reductase, membrane anchor subunit
MKSSSPLQTPLAKVKGLGSAKSGTEHFWHQRLTALANVPLTIAFVWIVLKLAGASYSEAMIFLAKPYVSLLLLLFIGVGLMHMRLGMQVIIEDYVHGEGLKIVALIGNTFFTLGVGAVCIFAILKISFGA